jgi:hypothetical protein
MKDLALLSIMRLIKGFCEDGDLEGLERVVDKVIAEAERGTKD